MARVFPEQITATYVAAYLAALGKRTPETPDGWETASFDLDDSFPIVEVRLANREYDDTARHAIEAAITMLPHFQSWVGAMMEPAGPNDGSDDHALADLSINGDVVTLRYVALNYNSDWAVGFSKGCVGLWYMEGGTVPLPGPPNPCRVIDPGWLAWNGGTVRTMALAIRDSRSFEEMPVLADALEEAGCANPAILAHCREPGEHGQRCCVLDLLLRTA